jgi:pyruvate/2-oxoglutarate dehydrogenase complex dihydrolipoamide dehydrogenase (E3) component
VDAYLQTTASHILAIGDVIGGYLFTHVAAYQAGVAVRNALVPVGKKKVDSPLAEIGWDSALSPWRPVSLSCLLQI